MGGKSSKKKAVARVERATKRDQPDVHQEGRMMTFHSRDPQSNKAAADSLLALEIMNERKWNPKKSAIQSELDKIHELSSAGATKAQKSKHHSKILKLSTDMLDDIESLFAKWGFKTTISHETADEGGSDVCIPHAISCLLQPRYGRRMHQGLLSRIASLADWSWKTGRLL